MCSHVGIIKDGELIEVATMDAIKKIRFKKVRFEAKETINPKLLEVAGVSQLKVNNQVASFVYTEEMASVVTLLNQFSIRDFWVEDSSLEEIFMHYYV